MSPQRSPQPDKRADYPDTGFDSHPGVDDAGQHHRAMLGEDQGSVPSATAPNV
jgi:hypothetical protein